MKGFLLIEKHGINFCGPNFANYEIKKITCVVAAESIYQLADITGGKQDFINLDEEKRPVIYFEKDLFSPYMKEVLQYKKGPINLFLREQDKGTYLFVVEIPLFNSNGATP